MLLLGLGKITQTTELSALEKPSSQVAVLGPGHLQEDLTYGGGGLQRKGFSVEVAVEVLLSVKVLQADT